MTVTIDVTAEDIARGDPDDRGRCPIARALRRTFRGCSSVSVKATFCLVYFGRTVIAADIPDQAQVFVDRMYRGHAVDPFAMELEFN